VNTLEHYIEYKRLNATKVMNALQLNGITSDECIFPDDVRDSGQAVYWLEDHMGEINKS
jgi:hypothetical protein